MCAVRKNSNGEFYIDRDYEINFVDLEIPEKEHTHDFAELVYTVAGKGIHIIDEKEYHVRAGDMILVNYGSRHSVIPIEQLRYADIMLRPAYISKALAGANDLFLILQLSQFAELSPSVKRDNTFLHFDVAERKKIEFILAWTEQEQKKRDNATELVLYSSLTLLLSVVFRRMTENQNTRFSVNDYLLQYIRQNCHGRLSVSEMAKSCGYTQEHFSRLFKAYTGKSVLGYITECRVQRAAELILNTDKPMEEIFPDCGFSNRTTFFRKFCEIMGTTPLKFRKNQK